MRVVAALALVGAWWATVYLGFGHWSAWAPWLAALVGAFVAPFTAYGFAARRSLPGSLTVYGSLGVLSAACAVEAWWSQRSQGTPESVAAVWLGLCALAAFTLGAVLAAHPIRGDRRAMLQIAAVMALSGVAAGGAAGAVLAGPGSCDRFEPWREHWLADRSAFAEAVVRCDEMLGWNRDEVEFVLGGRPGQEAWTLDTAWFTSRRLIVHYERGSVVATELSENAD